MHQGQESSSPQAWEWKATAEGTGEKVRTCRRGKAPLLGRQRGRGPDPHRKFLEPEPVCVPVGSQRVGQFWHRLQGSRSCLLVCSRPDSSGSGHPWHKATCYLWHTRWLWCRKPACWGHLLVCGLLGTSGTGSLQREALH